LFYLEAFGLALTQASSLEKTNLTWQQLSKHFSSPCFLQKKLSRL